MPARRRSKVELMREQLQGVYCQYEGVDLNDPACRAALRATADVLAANLRHLLTQRASVDEMATVLAHFAVCVQEVTRDKRKRQPSV